jgi:plastocyanin
VLLSGSVVLGAAEPKEEAGGAPVEDKDYDLLIEGSNFKFQKDVFDVPAGIALIKYTSIEGSHTLAFKDAEHAYFNLAVPPDSEEKALLVEGEEYEIYCTLPGHEAAGMHATIKVGAPGGSPEAGTATPPVDDTADNTSTTTAPSGDSEVDPAAQAGDELGN